MLQIFSVDYYLTVYFHYAFENRYKINEVNVTPCQLKSLLPTEAFTETDLNVLKVCLCANKEILEMPQ